MRYRKLRIAFSAVCGVLCVLLIALWVRSYWRMDQIYGHTSPKKVLHFGSMRGQLTLRYINNYNGSGIVRNWLPESETVSDILKRRQQLSAQDDLLVYRFNSRTGFGQLRRGVYFPHWLLVLAVGTLAMLSWTHWSWRFSLRTLLIATTVVAVGLGLIVAVSR